MFRDKIRVILAAFTFAAASTTVAEVRTALRTQAEVASRYGPGFSGRTTANGGRFDTHALTAAHCTLPFRTKVRVTNKSNGRSVVVRINDRGSYVAGRSAPRRSCIQVDPAASLGCSTTSVPDQSGAPEGLHVSPHLRPSVLAGGNVDLFGSLGLLLGVCIATEVFA
ncbi:septal ring lytic transglycosylase RlpA family protein [Methylobacterium sp. P31]